MTSRHPVECFPPAAYIEDELAARGKEFGWLLRESGRANVQVADVMERKRMTMRAAFALARAFGTSVELWVKLDDAYWEWLAWDLNRQAGGTS